MAEEEEEWPFINHYFIKCSRLVGFIATLVFLAVVLSTHHFSPKKFVFDAKSLECEPAEYKEDVMMDVGGSLFRKSYIFPIFQIIDFKKIFHRGDRTYSKFQLVEYVLDGVMPVDNNNPDKKSRMRQPNRTEIPVFINPGYGDSMDSHLALARIATDLTKSKNYRFRFYSLYPNQEAAHWSSTHYMYIRTFSEYSHFHLEKLYPKSRIIQICHLFGGDLGVRSAMEQYYARTRGIMTNTETGNLPDLFIRESAPHTLPGYYGTDIQSSIRANLRDWVEFKTRFSLGMISFDAGYDDTAVDTSWLKGKDIDRIPVWTIDGVPDTGLSAQKMLTCKPFLNQIADLLISYAEKDPDETGDSVAKAFYKKWEKKMQETVPIEWKKDNYDFVIRSGEKYEFVVNGARWIDVSLQRSENIWLNIKGSCCKCERFCHKYATKNRIFAIFGAGKCRFSS
ncbi:hypothetical protein CRE_01425 [Caenorhabditis remanei]|uniref:Uncharacterized protein n=1 Tax=Caenorhabditis remanei TaxID=31234 RepID=E3NKZ4_CAERE|nr:hypothetical protein CRE_01425 [Caenorhabditis remanei]